MNRKQTYRLMLRLFSVLFVGVLALMGLISLVAKKPTVSEVEKRELATCPRFSLSAWFSGVWTEGFDAFYADTFPGREGLVHLGAWLENLYGVRYDDVKFVDPATATTTAATTPVASDSETVSSSASDIGSSSASDSTTTTSSDAANTTVVDENQFCEQTGGIIIYGDRAMELFGGSTNGNSDYASILSTFAANFSDQNVYSIMVPSSVEFYLPKKYADYSNSEKDFIDNTYAAMSPSVHTVDAYSEISQHTAEYIYFRTDHHWTGKGAYYAYVAFCKEAGFTPVAYDSFETGSIDGFLGTLAASSNDSHVTGTPDTVEYAKVNANLDTTAYVYQKKTPSTREVTNVYHEYATGGNAYGVYLGGDNPRFEIVNDSCPDGKNVVIFKESYGNAFSPYLISHYHNVYILDMRYFSGSFSQFVEEHDIDDIIILNNPFAASTQSVYGNLKTFASN